MFFGPLILTTSKKMRGLGGFPELQISRFQKHQFQLSILPSLFGVSSLLFFRPAIREVVVIPCKFEQVERLEFRISNEKVYAEV